MKPQATHHSADAQPYNGQLTYFVRSTWDEDTITFARYDDKIRAIARRDEYCTIVLETKLMRMVYHRGTWNPTPMSDRKFDAMQAAQQEEIA